MTQPVRFFRKKPVIIRAMQFKGSTESATGILDWVLANGGNATYHDIDDPGEHVSWVRIDTLEGPMKVRPGDWVIQGIKGEFYPHAGHFFKEAYEEVAGDSPTISGVPG